MAPHFRGNAMCAREGFLPARAHKADTLARSRPPGFRGALSGEGLPASYINLFIILINHITVVQIELVNVKLLTKYIFDTPLSSLCVILQYEFSCGFPS